MEGATAPVSCEAPKRTTRITRSAHFFELLLPFWGSSDGSSGQRPPQRRRRENEAHATHRLEHPPLALAASTPLARVHMEYRGLTVAKTEFKRQRDASLVLPPCADAMSTPPTSTTTHVFTITATASPHLAIIVTELPVATSGFVHSLWWVQREKRHSDATWLDALQRHRAVCGDGVTVLSEEREEALAAVSANVEPAPLPGCGHCHRTMTEMMRDPLGRVPSALRLGLCLRGLKRTPKSLRQLTVKDVLLVLPDVLEKGGPNQLLDSVAWYGQLFALRLEALSVEPELLRSFSTWVSPVLRVLQFDHCTGSFSACLKDEQACTYTDAVTPCTDLNTLTQSASPSASLPSTDSDGIFAMTGLSSLTCTNCSGEGFWRAMLHFAVAPQQQRLCHDHDTGSSSTVGTASRASHWQPIPTRPLLYLELGDSNVGGKTLASLLEGIEQRNRVSYETFGRPDSRPACFSLQELSLAGIKQWTDMTWLDARHAFLGGGLRTLAMPRHHLSDHTLVDGMVPFLAARFSAAVPTSDSTHNRENEEDEPVTASTHQQPAAVAAVSDPSPYARRMWLLDVRWNLMTDNDLLRALLNAGLTAQHFRAAGTNTTPEVSKRFATVVTP